MVSNGTDPITIESGIRHQQTSSPYGHCKNTINFQIANILLLEKRQNSVKKSVVDTTERKFIVAKLILTCKNSELSAQLRESVLQRSHRTVKYRNIAEHGKERIVKF